MALKKKRRVVKKKTVKKRAPKKILKKSKPKARNKTSSKAKPKTSKPKQKTKISASKKNANSIGKITHYFPHVRAAVIKLTAPLSIGDSIKIKGHTTDFTQVITSMQVDRVNITSAKPGQEIGLLVNSRVRQHDTVTKV